jgi:hypothetical protein
MSKINLLKILGIIILIFVLFFTSFWIWLVNYSPFGRFDNKSYPTNNQSILISNPNAFLDSSKESSILFYQNKLDWNSFKEIWSKDKSKFKEPESNYISNIASNYSNQKEINKDEISINTLLLVYPEFKSKTQNTIQINQSQNNVILKIETSNYDMYNNYAIKPESKRIFAKEFLEYTGLDCRIEVVQSTNIITVTLRGKKIESKIQKQKPVECKLSNLPSGKYYIDYLNDEPQQKELQEYGYKNIPKLYWQGIIEIK